MNKFLEELIELNRLERRLQELEPIEKSIKAPLLRLEAKKKKVLDEFDKIVNEIRNLKVKISQSELLIAELKDKLKDIEEKQSRIKSEKEYKALQIEEELAKEQINVANEEIERLERIIEQKEEKKAELEKELEKIDADITLTKLDVDKKLETIEAQKKTIYEKINNLVSQMNPQIYRFYEKIKRWAGISAVTPVRKQACTGCHMRISDKVYAEVVKGEDITTCPHCGRVLFVESEDDLKDDK